MIARISLAICLLACSPAWCQVESGTTDTAAASTADHPLLVPPPVSTGSYSTDYAGELESNFFTGGLTLGSAYSTNISNNPYQAKSGVSFSIWPSLLLNKGSDRSQLLLSYTPGLTTYPTASAYNQFDQNLLFDWKYGLSPNLSLDVQELFRRTSNVFNQPNPISGSAVGGSVPLPQQAIIVPLADQVTNTTSVQLTYQLSAEGMLGASGSFGTFYYPDPSQVTGLFNSRSASGSAFYSQRVHEKYYVGVNYQFENILTYQSQNSIGQTNAQIQTLFGFITIYLKPTLSLSISAGPQYYSASQTQLPSSASWSPIVMTSLGWQGERSSAAISWSRTVSGAGGLNGVFESNSVSLTGQRQLSRDWKGALSASYLNYQNLTPFFFGSSPGGNTITGTASVQRSIGEHFNIQGGYNWVRQNYQQVATPLVPNTSRVFISFGYQFTRPLHR